MFYLIEIATGDPKVAGKAIYEYSTENDAIASFHAKMGSAMKSELYSSELLIVVDSDGILVKREKYVVPVVVPEDVEPSEVDEA